MEWVDTLNSLLALITGLCGLVGTGVGVYFAIKNWIKACKEKDSKEVWLMIMNMADSAIKEAERTTMSGADKKAIVIESVKAGCKAAGINMDQFLDQLSDYIDQTIKFINDMSKIEGDKKC